MKGPIHVTTIAADAPGLGPLIQRAHRLAALGVLVRSWLSPTLASHVEVANLRDGTLVLSARSAAWATKLRYEIPTVLAAAKRHGATSEIRDVKVVVTTRS